MANPENRKKALESFARFSSISFQMLATIGIFVFIGYKIDSYIEGDVLIATALSGLVGVIISLYQIVRQLNKK